MTTTEELDTNPIVIDIDSIIPVAQGLSMTSPLVINRADHEDVQRCIDAAKPCIHGAQCGYRVLHTQERGQVLPVPRVVGYFASMFNTEEVLRQYRKDGSFAIMTPLYECGHDHLQWDEFWR